MADFALLDSIGLDELFNFRAAVAPYYKCGLPPQLVEETASDILLDAYMRYSPEKFPKKESFCVYCYKQLRSIWKVAKRRRMEVSLDASAMGSFIKSTPEDEGSTNIMSLIDGEFMHHWEAIFDAVLSEESDKKLRIIAQKRFIEGKPLKQIASEMGFNSRQAISRYIREICSRVLWYVRRHRENIYLHFDERLADAIMDFAKI